VSRPPRFRLEVLEGETPGTFEAGPEKPVTLGRAVDNVVVLRDRTVSRHHAVIVPTAEGYRIEDAGSLAGTKRRGEPVPRGGALLVDGDRLTLGRMQIRFTLLPAGQGERIARDETEVRRERPAEDVDEGGEPFAGYRVLRTLEAADDAEVVLALDPATRKRVTLQRIPASRLGWLGSRRFLRRCGQSRTLRHENLLQPVACGRSRGLVYVAYPYVGGATVETLLRDAARDLSLELATYVAREVARALAWVETQRRRDLRPEVTDRTVVVTAAGRCMLRGLGVPPLPQEGGRSGDGPSRYSAPEEDAGRQPDQRAPIFSLAVLLYELLTREPIEARQKATLRSVDTVRIEVPARLAEIVMRALEVRPDDRFDSAADLEAGLGEELTALDPRFGAEEVRMWMAAHLPGREAR
jgi:serine/threonine-protein kinase